MFAFIHKKALFSLKLDVGVQTKDAPDELIVKIYIKRKIFGLKLVETNYQSKL